MTTSSTNSGANLASSQQAPETSSSPSSGTLKAYRSELRRSHMDPAQRAGLQRCAIAIERFRNRNERMAVGLRCGFRRLEKNEIPEDELERTLAAIRHELAVKMAQKNDEG